MSTVRRVGEDVANAAEQPEEDALSTVLQALVAPPDEKTFWASLRALHVAAAKPNDAAFNLHLLPQPEVLDALARLLRRCRPHATKLLSDSLRAMESAESAIANGSVTHLDSGNPRGHSAAAPAGFGVIPSPQAQAVQAYCVSTLLHLVGGVESPPFNAAKTADNAAAVALHPRILMELQILTEAAIAGTGDAQVGMDALLIVALVAHNIDVSGQKYAVAVVQALGGLEAATNARNGPGDTVKLLSTYGNAACSYYAACTEQLLPLWFKAAGWAALPHNVLMCLCQAIALTVSAQSSVSRMVAVMASPEGAAFLTVIRDALLELPRSLWPEMSSELQEWRRALDDDDMMLISQQQQQLPQGGDRSSAPKPLPAAPLFDARFDTRAGHRYYDYVALIGVVREREARLRREMRAEAEAEEARRRQVEAAEAAAAAGGLASSSSSGAIEGSSGMQLETNAGAIASDDIATQQEQGGVAPPAASPGGSAPVSGADVDMTAGSSSSSAVCSATVLSTAEPEKTATSAPLAPWRTLSLQELSKDVTLRTQALQRRDGAVLVVTALSNIPAAHKAILSTPGLLARIIGAVRTSVGYQETPALASAVIRSLAQHGDVSLRNTLMAAGAVEALQAAAQTQHNLFRRKQQEAQGAGAGVAFM